MHGKETSHHTVVESILFIQRTAPFGEALINQLLTALKEAGLPEG
jgi:hypothetical protein